MVLRSDFKVQAKTPGSSRVQGVAEAPTKIDLGRKLPGLNLAFGLETLINDVERVTRPAFLFQAQVSSNRYLREALAARQQPLILDYKQFRPIQSFKWINIYSPMDIVSGHLDYYDHPDDPHYNPVANRIDRDAWKPFLAQTQYWNNEELQKSLYEAVWARRCPTTKRCGPSHGAASDLTLGNLSKKHTEAQCSTELSQESKRSSMLSCS